MSHQPFHWGTELYPGSDAVRNFLVHGAMGSGKTTLLQLLALDVLADVRNGRPYTKAVFYDYKRDMIPFLTSLGFTLSGSDGTPGDIVLLNPRDMRSHNWDIARDIPEPVFCQSFAKAFVPVEQNDTQPFFRNQSRNIVDTVLGTLHKLRGNDWCIPDFLGVLSNKERLIGVLGALPRGQDDLSHFHNSKETFENITASITQYTAQFRYIAALMDANDTGENAFSLYEWFHDPRPGILVLSHEPDTPEAFSAVNRMVLSRLSALLAGSLDTDSLPEQEQRRTWIFLDEFTQLGHMDFLPELMNVARAKGGALVFAFQSFQRLIQVYGEHNARNITGQCQFQAHLYLQEAKDKEWSADCCGKEIRQETGHSSGMTNSEQMSLSSGQQTSYAERHIIHPQEFTNLGRPGDSGLPGVFIAPRKPAQKTIVPTDRYHQLLQARNPVMERPALEPHHPSVQDPDRLIEKQRAIPIENWLFRDRPTKYDSERTPML